MSHPFMLVQTAENLIAPRASLRLTGLSPQMVFSPAIWARQPIWGSFRRLPPGPAEAGALAASAKVAYALARAASMSVTECPVRSFDNSTTNLASRALW